VSIEAAPSNSAPGFLTDLAAKVLNSTEDAHLKTMNTFETGEHLQELTPRKFAKGATEAFARRQVLMVTSPQFGVASLPPPWAILR
jgi:hypothetical protein